MTFSKYAEQKFDILNKYKVFYTREDILDVVYKPEKLEKKNCNETGWHFEQEQKNICEKVTQTNQQSQVTGAFTYNCK